MMKAVVFAAASLVLCTLPLRAESVLRVVPQSDLRVFDPVWTTSQLTQAHALLVYDQLFALDSRQRTQPAMIGSWTTDADGLVWTFTLQPALKFSDGSPVKSRDVVPSIRRWTQRSADGQFILARTAAIEPQGGNGFTIRLTRPFRTC